METKIKTITPETIEQAKNLIFDGEVVAIPTETVYGLGGNAFDDNAVKRIFTEVPELISLLILTSPP